MTPPLFLVDAVAVAVGGTLVLDGEEGRHAARVRRIGVGETVLIGDGRGTVAECRVDGVGSSAITLDVMSRRSESRPSPLLVLVQALPKGERAELVVELATELGVDEIVPWAATRSVARWDGPRAVKSVERWRRVAREAAKQSRRAWVPGTAELATTAQVVTRAAASAGVLTLQEGAATSISDVELPSDGELLIVVGPEGGIAPDELDAFDGAGAVATRLGAPVLRTSTAGGAALAALSLRLGRWS